MLEECEALSHVLMTSACQGPENCFALASVSPQTRPEQTWAQEQPTATPHLAEWRVLPTARLVPLTAWLCGDNPPSVCLRCQKIWVCNYAVWKETETPPLPHEQARGVRGSLDSPGCGGGANGSPHLRLTGATWRLSWRGFDHSAQR